MDVSWGKKNLSYAWQVEIQQPHPWCGSTHKLSGIGRSGGWLGYRPIKTEWLANPANKLTGTEALALRAFERRIDMDDVLNILRLKNPVDVTDHELAALQDAIENAIRAVNKLQAFHRGLTGRNYVPKIRII